MKRVKIIFAGLAALLAVSCAGKRQKVNLSKDDIVGIAREAYIYATPLIYMDVTRVISPVPDNYLYHSHAFPDHTFRHVVAPNNDTNYSTAFLELGDEPMVVELPDTKGRYYVFPLLDAWTNNFILPGKRTTGTGAQKYLIAGTRWQGAVPEGLTLIKSPTDLVWIIGRIQVNSPEDQQKVVTPLQEQFVLKPLSAWLSGDDRKAVAEAPKHKLYGNFVPADIREKSVVRIVQNLSVEDFFNYFNALLTDNPPAAADSAVIERIAAIGVGAGKRFSLSAFDRETQEALTRVPSEVYQEFAQPLEKGFFGKTTHDPAAKTGDFKTDYHLRALVAYVGLGALPPEEAVYYSYYTDKEQEPLHGKHKYRIHFEKGQLPPAQAFWSYTVYGKDRYLVDNPIRRYAIGDRNDLKYNKDGSLDLYLSPEAPEKDKISNWLPTSHDEFNVTLRIYIPVAELLKDPSSWHDPLPEKIN
ncbi:MAG: DUF1254 domain-containing protein [Bacteroidales bacterium]|jgi:hypothetical protein|nr:DUF1254 domain-containing protein [Bacteroidales bacterium]